MNSLQLCRLRGAKSFNPNIKVPKEVCLEAAEQLLAEVVHQGCRTEFPWPQQGGSRVGAPAQGCTGSSATPIHDGPGACRASFILNALKLATLLLCVLHYFLRTLVYTQCCGTILIQWWCAFSKGITFGTLSGS